MKRLLFLLFAAGLFGGCATVSTVDLGDGRKTIEASNTCWRFLMLPVASGDWERPNECGCNWFRNDATVERQMAMIEKEAERLGATRVSDIRTLTTDEDLALFIFLRENIHTSATVDVPVPAVTLTNSVPVVGEGLLSVLAEGVSTESE